MIEMPTATHRDISHQYGCTATLTDVTFFYCGIVHRARRFWREDLPASGKIELYTIERYPGSDATSLTEFGWYTTTGTEDWFRYVDRFKPSTVDAFAMRLIAAAISGQCADLVGEEQATRFGLIELQ